MAKNLRVVLNVRDFESVVAFYTDTVGFPSVGGWDRGPDDRGALIEVTTGAIIEVVGRGLSFEQPTYDDLAIAVELGTAHQIDQEFARLTAVGLAVSSPQMQIWGHYSMSARDPVGLKISFYAEVV